jgi:hypothetical protein
VPARAVHGQIPWFKQYRSLPDAAEEKEFLHVLTKKNRITQSAGVLIDD